MRFSSMLLYIDDEFPNKAVFEKLLAVSSERYRKGKYLYTVEQRLISDRYYWMYFQYDNERLYVDTVVDISDNSEKDNPRPKNQVETRHQLFACFDLSKNMLYVSDYSKKAIVPDYIKEMLLKPVVVKNVFKSFEEFVAAVKYLKSVTFTQRRNIFTSSDGSIFRRNANLYGLDLPERCKLKFDYGTSPIGIINTSVQNLKLGWSKDEFEDVIIVGTDDSGVESAFNFSSVVSSIEIELARNENDRYNPEEVCALLLSKLGA